VKARSDIPGFFKFVDSVIDVGNLLIEHIERKKLTRVKSEAMFQASIILSTFVHRRYML